MGILSCVGSARPKRCPYLTPQTRSFPELPGTFTSWLRWLNWGPGATAPAVPHTPNLSTPDNLSRRD